MQKAKRIRDMFRLHYWDEEFSTRAMKESDPFAGLVSINGVLLPASFLPPEVRKLLENDDELEG